ncbi:MAG: pantoate--beta-alanine ligase [Planctomycetales bacterium]
METVLRSSSVISSSPREPTVVTTVAELREHVRSARQQGKSIGLVPTMGALHAGHVSLIEAARRDCGYVVVTVFVNPTQFGPKEDLQKYPRPWEDDLAKCRDAGVDLIFRPDVAEVYPKPFFTVVDVTGISEVLEGAHRPGHFQGVATVVLKLFNMAQPDIAYFGQKDFQQQLLIRRMTKELDLPLEIRTCPTIREPDGLALSSRNVYLSPEERRSALALSRCLRHAETRLKSGEKDLAAIRAEMKKILSETPHVVPDYATLVDPETIAELSTPQREQVAVVAAKVGTTRLIDNLPISLPQ